MAEGRLRKPEPLSFGTNAEESWRIHELSEQDAKFMQNKLNGILEEYKDLFDNTLGKLPTRYKITVDPEVTPIIRAVRKVPVAVKDKLKEELDNMVAKGIIAPVTKPIDWVSALVVVMLLVTTKKNSDELRICSDPGDLNKAIKRPRYPLRTIEEAVSNMPNAKYFTVVDAKQAFYHIPLEEKSSYLTCFGTPYGRYRYCRMPMGISSASEVYQCAMEHLLAGYPCLVIVDNILVYGATELEHDDNLKKVLKRLREINLKLSVRKCQYKLQEVPYIGHVLSKDGLKPDPEKVRAISEMPTPQDATDLLRFFGMVKYLAKFVPNRSEKAAPLNELLRKDNEWKWDISQQFRDYVFGKKVTIETDHQPLVSIVKKPLSATPARLQCLLLRLQSYSFNLVYKKSSDLYLADTLSRAYLPIKDSDTDLESTQDYEILSVLPISSKKLEELKEATSNDVTLKKVHKAIVMGSSKSESELRPFYPFGDELIEDEGVILKGQKIVVPKALQREYANLVHSGHLGAEATKRRARDIMYWPSMCRDIDDIIGQCNICHSTKLHQSREPLLPYPVPSRPWAIVGTDLFEWHGIMYLVPVDSYSGWFELSTVTDTSTKTVVQKLKSHFSRFGIPDMLISDSGSQFTSREFKDFAAAWGLHHTMSSPHFHSSNGLAEKAVQSAKQLLEKSFRDGTDPYLNILNWRNTPRDNTLGSPAQRNLSRRTTTTIPTAEALLKPEILDPESFL
ncbi:PREDICTED: uncharacterized protein LOC106818304 [Priapulus caudatus]|uniref:RNA-directed DNA polymerase n=1 Tax=Priapulus caudatus TaxID=37621 RepID=A0ABM1F239_PRICU|nr:PREDICTED: uncharacterized protein LOC106818304 [Priapulus caudatus]